MCALCPCELCFFGCRIGTGVFSIEERKRPLTLHCHAHVTPHPSEGLSPETQTTASEELSSHHEAQLMNPDTDYLRETPRINSKKNYSGNNLNISEVDHENVCLWPGACVAVAALCQLPVLWCSPTFPSSDLWENVWRPVIDSALPAPLLCTAVRLPTICTPPFCRSFTLPFLLHLLSER